MGKKVFSFPETGFFLRGFSRCYSWPRGAGGIFSFPRTGAFVIFCTCSLSGQVSLTSNALASSKALAYLKGKCRHSDKQTDGRSAVDPDWSKGVLYPL